MSRSVTILLVEDDQAMREGIADWLEMAPTRYDMQVLKAGHGKIALDLMDLCVPDLIVSDIMMPEMGGYVFLCQVRQNPEWLHIPFIFLSAKGEDRDVRRGRLSEANLYLTKPFETRELAELIQTQLDRHFEREQTRIHALEYLKKNMLQILNHEFRTPLTYVTAYYDMLKDNPDGRNVREYLRGIQAGCVRLTQLVSDLIMVVELRSGEAAAHFQAHTRPLNIVPILQAAIEAKQNLAAERRAEIKVTTPENVPPVFADTVSIQEIFERILDNAIKFSQPRTENPSQVTVTVTIQENTLLIAFADEGIGIPETMHEQIFKLFEQHNRGVLEQQGTGLGLTIAKELAELHDGRIELQSVAGQGSTFTLALPVYDASGSLAAPARGSGNGRIQATVLLVEDNENLMVGLADLLEIHSGKYQLRVLTALNGQLGLEVIQETVPDLIISDIMMPVMDGYQFLGTVRSNPEWLNIPFIFLTAKGERRDQHKGYVLGVEEYITKPYDSDDVLLFIEKQLDKHFYSQQVVQQDFDALKRNILNIITPELIEPITSVTHHTEMLADVNTEAELATSLREIQVGGTRLNILIEDLIALAELVTGEAEVAYGWQAQPIANLGLLLFETCQIVSHQKYPDIKIHCPFNEEVGLVFGDSSLLLACVERLLAFARDNCQASLSKITLSVATEMDNVTVTIAGNSPLKAKPTRHLETILTASDINVSNLPDYAAGLYIVRGHVGLHDGRFSYSNTSDEGFTFTIALPVYVPD